MYLEAVGQAIKGSAVGLGAQNCYHEAKGRSPARSARRCSRDIGCKYVILGHSERRQIFKESNQDVNRKVLAALARRTDADRVRRRDARRSGRPGKTAAVVREQIEGSLAGLSAEQMLKIVIAYEPVWAIGTGVVATPEQAEEVHADLRRLLETRYNSQVASAVRIQYGGSVNAENAASLLGQPNIDGALVGGASLKADSFLAIVAAAAAAELVALDATCNGFWSFELCVLAGDVDWLHYLFMIPLALLSVFLILVILVQRGRGGGLTGALGGMGGQSAFGTKAGDLFTRITIVVAAIWVLLSMASLEGAQPAAAAPRRDSAADSPRQPTHAEPARRGDRRGIDVATGERRRQDRTPASGNAAEPILQRARRNGSDQHAADAPPAGRDQPATTPPTPTRSRPTPPSRPAALKSH